MYHFYRQQCPPGTLSYIIRPGDNFYRLSIRFSTTVAAIISANPTVNLNALRIGQRICIPRQRIYPPCPEGNYYTIRRGDTLYAIASFYNVSLDDLIEANPGINPYMLMVGQVICIPLATPPVTCPAGTTSYIVKAGDTFYKIAIEFDTTIAEIKRLNPSINPEALLVGQIICVPGVETELPATKQIPVFVEGETEYRQAVLERSELGYYIYVLNNFEFTSEEPGRDVLFSTFDDRFFVRLEKLPNDADISQLRANALVELRDIGRPNELSGEEILDPYFRQSEFFLQASNANISKNIIVQRIDGELFKFTMFLPNAEAAEGIIPSFYAMLKTIKPI